MRKKIIYGILTVTAVFGMVQAISTSVPGSDDDPIVTKSYVDSVISALKTELDGKTTTTVPNDKEDEDDKKDDEKETQGQPTMEFKVVNVGQGRTITCDASTQVILRAGKAKVTSPHESGLSDLTGGNDIVKDQYIELNHLLLVPRTDGRGLVFEEKSIILISGTYTLD